MQRVVLVGRVVQVAADWSITLQHVNSQTYLAAHQRYLYIHFQAIETILPFYFHRHGSLGGAGGNCFGTDVMGGTGAFWWEALKAERMQAGVYSEHVNAGSGYS